MPANSAQKNYPAGLTLLEIIISIVILSLIVSGLTALFVSGKRYILHARSRMSGGELGKLFLDPLQMAVRQDTWGQAANPLSITGIGSFRYCDSDPGHATQQQPSPFCPSQAERTLDNIEYSAQYEINPHPQNPNLRKAILKISWLEPS